MLFCSRLSDSLKKRTNCCGMENLIGEIFTHFGVEFVVLKASLAKKSEHLLPYIIALKFWILQFISLLENPFSSCSVKCNFFMCESSKCDEYLCCLFLLHLRSQMFFSTSFLFLFTRCYGNVTRILG